jgi:hypothetical protein
VVKGLDIFRKHFADHIDQFVLIGGRPKVAADTGHYKGHSRTHCKGLRIVRSNRLSEARAVVPYPASHAPEQHGQLAVGRSLRGADRGSSPSGQRNIGRFPADLIFQFTATEWPC